MGEESIGLQRRLGADVDDPAPPAVAHPGDDGA